MDKFWVPVAAAVIGVGLNVLVKVIDVTPGVKRLFTGVGILLIVVGLGICGVFALGKLGMQFRSPIVFGDKQDQEVSAQWSSQLLMPVHNKAFRAETVKLDGYAYVNCEFDDVTFEYEGTAPTSIVNPTIKRPSGGGRVINFRSGNSAVRQTMRLISMLNKLVGEEGVVNMSSDSSLPVK